MELAPLSSAATTRELDLGTLSLRSVERKCIQPLPGALLPPKDSGLSFSGVVLSESCPPLFLCALGAAR